MSDRFTIRAPNPDRGQQLARLADRLGVSAMPADATAELIIAMPDGAQYDVLAVVNALLDRLEAAEQRR